MTIYRLILPPWACDEFPHLKKVKEGFFSDEEVQELNAACYNIYYLPNYPKDYSGVGTVDGSQVDTFEWVFADFDLKEGKYASKEAFISAVMVYNPTKLVDSGNGIHAYWRVNDLDAMAYLRLSRRIMRELNTDEAVGQIYQLMRVPGTINTKNPEDLKACELLFDDGPVYTAEQVDSMLASISQEDEEYCQQHFTKTYRLHDPVAIDDEIPLKFAKLISNNTEAKEIWAGGVDDRSKSDYRLGHIMFGNGFTKEEAASVLVNSAKALARSPSHRVSYAQNIIEKIWTFEITKDAESLDLSMTVREILQKKGDNLKGTRFPCWRYLDATDHGFRLGQVVGLVAGSGVGKTAMALNMFEGFVQNNPDYDHFFIPLEQPTNEIADRWKTMCGDKTHLHDKVHVISNYAEDGSFRHLSFTEIKDYLLKFQKVTGRKIGCVVIDHIGALKKQGKDGENQDLMTICHQMKAFAIETNTMLVMQSQAPREKAGIGDLELNKDAAYGTVYFESYCDYVVTIWQPLKRCYAEDGCPTVTAFKFCKIRHKKKDLDEVQEDVCYRLYFDSKSEHLRELTQNEEASFDYFLQKATNRRKLDRKTDIVEYQSMPWTEEEVTNGTPSNNQDSSRVS